MTDKQSIDQCVAIKKSDGERCENRVFHKSVLCGIHSRADDVQTIIPEETDT